MCGRYASFLPAEALARTFGTVNPLPNFERTWNMAPTRDAPVIRLARDGQRHLDALKWGLVPYFTKDLKKARKPINARSETVATSGMFREAFAKRRCLVPAPIYYEWRDDPDGKTPFAVARVDGEPVAFAGIWEEWRSPGGEKLSTFATITTDANTLLASIQDRMPVITERAGPSGLAKPQAIPLRCCVRRRRTCCGFGRSTRRWATSGTRARNLSDRCRRRRPRCFRQSNSQERCPGVLVEQIGASDVATQRPTDSRRESPCCAGLGSAARRRPR
jgi:putative SOS response-associated peptidase YedK